MAKKIVLLAGLAILLTNIVGCQKLNPSENQKHVKTNNSTISETKATNRIESEFSDEEAREKAIDLVVKKFDLTYNEETDTYTQKGSQESLQLVANGFDENGRYEIRICPSDYPLSVYSYCYVDLENGTVYTDDEGEIDAYTLTKQELLGLVDLTKDEIISKLGKQYTIILTGAENSFEGYCYENFGITIVFGYDGSVAFIDCDEKVVIDGVHGGMNFSQIQEKLGEAEITETFLGVEENKGYKIEYKIGNCVLKFFSYSLDGSDSDLTIYRNMEFSENTVR